MLDLESVEYVPRHLGREGRGKHGAADDVRGQMAHRQIEGNRLAGTGQFVEPLHVVCDGCLHGVEGKVDPHHREGRINHGALAAPLFAVGDKDRLADQRFQRADHEVTLGEYTVGVTQDMAHQFGLVEQHGAAARVAEIAYPETISSGWQQFQQVAVAAPEHSGKRYHRPQRERAWRVVVCKE